MDITIWNRDETKSIQISRNIIYPFQLKTMFPESSGIELIQRSNRKHIYIRPEDENIFFTLENNEEYIVVPLIISTSNTFTSCYPIKNQYIFPNQSETQLHNTLSSNVNKFMSRYVSSSSSSSKAKKKCE